MGTPINNPLFKINPTKKHDDFKDVYDIEMTNKQLRDANSSLIAMAYQYGGKFRQLKDQDNRIRPIATKNDLNIVRTGLWS